MKVLLKNATNKILLNMEVNKSDIVEKSVNTQSSIDTNKEFSRRRNKIIKAVNNKMVGYSSKEVVISKVRWFGKVKLGFNSLNTDLKSIYIKYDSIGRRLWTVW